MSGKLNIKYTVILTFDVDVKGNNGVYKEVSDLLDEKGLKQQISDKKLPSNIYTGVRVAEVEYKGEHLTLGDVKRMGDVLNSTYWIVVNSFFKSKKLDHSIFVSVSRSETTSLKYE
ncbi:hypothetical protein [Morganella morganii]|uniref:hypothetical protein n=1 Tax=Morganella morganii TaxID=582 RepID=UPI002809288B|nr:hypothetical protein SUGSMm_14750 [Morganella morganii subsp. sibonii]HDU8310076.1 hypothetical protein [Morganella morganii subsp. sibonii]